jgi:hypothetical protein
VGVALTLIAGFSVIDLVLTSHLVTHGGMFELNPLARAVMTEFGATWPLAFFKLGTVSLATGILYRLRRFRQAEMGAWLATAALAAVMVTWWMYLGETGWTTPDSVRDLSAQDAHWVG